MKTAQNMRSESKADKRDSRTRRRSGKRHKKRSSLRPSARVGNDDSRLHQSHETSKPQVLPSSIAAVFSLWTAVMASTWYHCAGHVLTANPPHLAAIVIDRVDGCSYGTEDRKDVLQHSSTYCCSTAIVQ